MWLVYNNLTSAMKIERADLLDAGLSQAPMVRYSKLAPRMLWASYNTHVRCYLSLGTSFMDDNDLT